MPRKSRKEWYQDDIVLKLTTEIETLDEDEFDELYEELDDDHKEEVDAAVRDFADSAIGDEHWDSDN